MEGYPIAYRATASCVEGPWRPSMFMPRWASRITLEVTGIRAERIKDIDCEDIVAEGLEVPDVDYSVPDHPHTLDAERERYARDKFRTLWDEINGKRKRGAFAFARDPWVWRVEFRVAEAPGAR